MSKANPIEPSPIPPHMLEDPQTKGQKKAFAKVKRAESTPKKAVAKKTAKSESGYGSGSGKEEKP